MKKPLTLTLKEKLTQRIDLSAITPDELAKKPINKIKIAVGKKNIAVEKLFEIEGDDIESIIIKKSNNLFDNVGKSMTHGRLEVRGSVGDRAGQNLNGGELVIKGNADNYAGTGMLNGRIEIQRNAGDFLGGALPGKPQGMKGGNIHVFGNAGDRCGDKMRRGMIVIEGDSGDYTGSRMIAGTIMICGQAGNNTGFSMKRGTIILTDKPQGMPATFNNCGTFELAFLNLIFNSLANSSRRLKALKDNSSWVERYAGDLGMDGKGELLVLQ